MIQVTSQPLLEFPELRVSDQIQEELVQRFLKSIRIRGDFPSSLTLLETIFQGIDGGEISSTQVAKTLQVDHVLALRLIALVNMGYYNSGTPILNISAAVDHFGLIRLKEILPSLADSKNFNAIFLGHAVALGMMQQAIVASVIASELTMKIAPARKIGEIAYLTTVISNLAPLMLAYHRPDIFSVLALSCQDGYIPFKNTLRAFMGCSLAEFAAQLADEMYLPATYLDLCRHLDQPPWVTITDTTLTDDQQTILKSTYAANMLAHEICNFTGIQGVQSVIRELEQRAAIDHQLLEDVLGNIGNVYSEHTENLFLKAVRLPEYLSWFAPEVDNGQNERWLERLPGILQRINPFLYDLRTCMRASLKRPSYPLFPQALQLTLSALIKGLNFDRAVFFKISDEQTLSVGLTVGVKLFEPDKFIHKFDMSSESDDPAGLVMKTKEPVFSGQPLFPEGWPFAAFPAIWKNKVIGIFYADRIRRPDVDSLTNQEQIACTALAEEWKDLPAGFV